MSDDSRSSGAKLPARAPPQGGEPVDSESAPQSLDSLVSPDAPARSLDRDWIRPLALFAVVLGLSVARPGAVIALPLVALVAFLPTGNPAGVLVGAAAAILVFTGWGGEGLWFAERGWAIVLSGWFLTLTLKWPGTGFFTRAIGSVLGAIAVVSAGFLADPGAWIILDWMVGDRMLAGVEMGLQIMSRFGGEGGGISPTLVTTVYQTAELQALVFPALLCLESIAALGVAWWIYVRLAHGASGSLSPLREFRFNDQLIWLLIGGLVLVVLDPGTHWSRAGSNALVFMCALYAVRGAGVVAFMSGGLSLFGGALLLFGLVFVAPVIFAGALVIGVGDTWLDVRERVRRLTA